MKIQPPGQPVSLQPARARQPRFGIDLSTIGSAVIQGVTQNSGGASGPERTSRMKRQKLRRFFRWNIVATPVLTGLLANLGLVTATVRQVENRREAQPINSVLERKPHPEQTVSTSKLIALTRKSNVNVPPSTLVEMAKAGMIKEVLSSSPNDPAGKAVLIDAREITAGLDPAARQALTEKYNVPIVRPPYQEIQLSWVQAAIISGLLVNLLASVTPQKARFGQPLSAEEKKRQASNEMGRYLVALHQGVSDLPLMVSDIDAQLATTWLMDERNPMTVEDVQKRLPVLLGGFAAETILHESTSITALNSKVEASKIANLLWGRLDVGGQFENYVPGEYTAEQKAQMAAGARRMIDEAMETATQALSAIPRERLEGVRDLFVDYDVLKPDDIKAIVAGTKTIDDYRQSKKKLRLPRVSRGD